MAGNKIQAKPKEVQAPSFELSADPFYSKEDMAELERRVSDIRTGKSVLKPHGLIEA